MKKKTDSRLCWNCEGDVSFELHSCPYCSVDLDLQTTPTLAPAGDPPMKASAMVSTDEWNEALEKEDKSDPSKNEMISLLLLLPGVVLFLFAIAILFFADDGVLKLQWKEDFAYFYFLGALPLLFFGWRSLNK